MSERAGAAREGGRSFVLGTFRKWRLLEGAVLFCLCLTPTCSPYPRGAYLYGPPVRGVGELRELDWPPRRFTTFYPIPRRALLGGASTLGRAAELIGERLGRAGLEASVFGIGKDGFAVVTTVRCIDELGRHEPKQGAACLNPYARLRGDFSFGDYLDALFGGRAGHYRMFVVVVTPRPLSPSVQAPSWERALAARSMGATHLPAELANQDVVERTVATLLVYEFQRDSLSDGQAALVEASAIRGRDHAIRSGLFREEELQ